jgi:hemerythrin
VRQSGHNFRELSEAERFLIEDEHARLERFLQDLRETCSEFVNQEECHGCAREKIASCQGRLTSFFYDFLDLVSVHFENEEKVISEILQTQEASDYFRHHQKEHANLMREMESLMHESSAISRQGRTAAAIRNLYQRVAERFIEHARGFDDIFLHPPKS